MLNVVRNHPLISFFTLAFVLAWSILIPMVLSSYGLVPEVPLPLMLAMGYAPTLAAILVSAVGGGKGAVMQVLVIAALLVASRPISYRGQVADRITR